MKLMILKYQGVTLIKIKILIICFLLFGCTNNQNLKMRLPIKASNDHARLFLEISPLKEDKFMLQLTWNSTIVERPKVKTMKLAVDNDLFILNANKREKYMLLILDDSFLEEKSDFIIDGILMRKIANAKQVSYHILGDNAKATGEFNTLNNFTPLKRFLSTLDKKDVEELMN